MSEVTLTREDLLTEIKKLQIQIRTNEASNDPRNYGHLNTQHKREIAVYNLALVGLSVQPRPIEEAPKDGVGFERKRIYAFNPRWKTYKLAYWDEDRYCKKPRPYWSYEGERTTESRGFQPAHFIHLSSLPTPKDK